MTKSQISNWYGRGLTDEQLDGTGAVAGGIYTTRNYVSLGVITQAQADGIRAETPYAGGTFGPI